MAIVNLFKQSVNYQGYFWNNLGWSFLSVFIITAFSLSLALLIAYFHVKGKVTRRYLSFLVAMSIGSLVGDAIFHLIPEALEMSKDDHIKLGYLCCLFAGIYFFFVFEKLLQHYHHGHGHGGDHNHNEYNPARNTTVGSLDSTNSIEESEIDEESIIGHPHNHEHFNPNHELASYLLLAGDGLHNFVDGIAIGISFTNSLETGLSTSIAILLHELPHEMGDFAIFLESGMSIKKAFLWALGSNCFSFLGALFGVGLNEARGLRPWILAFTAGNFLYIALSDLVPELLHEHQQKQSKTWRIWLIENIGILVGTSFMILIKIFMH